MSYKHIKTLPLQDSHLLYIFLKTNIRKNDKYTKKDLLNGSKISYRSN
jgi:hypothetical protein